jgi:hypothetical protein
MIFNYKGARESAIFSLGVEEVSISSGGLEDLRKGEIKVCRLDLLPSIRKRGDG